jgi:cytochrome c-type biogenesis protein CcmH
MIISFKKRAVPAILFIFMLLLHSTGHTNTLYPLNTPKQDAQFTHLLRELRCLVCQNQDLADSNAGLAKDLRDEVYKLVKSGKSDDEIVHYLTARYGDFILFKPPVKAVTALLWFGPALFMLLGILIFWRTCFKRNRDE